MGCASFDLDPTAHPAGYIDLYLLFHVSNIGAEWLRWIEPLRRRV